MNRRAMIHLALLALAALCYYELGTFQVEYRIWTEQQIYPVEKPPITKIEQIPDRMQAVRHMIAAIGFAAVIGTEVILILRRNE